MKQKTWTSAVAVALSAGALTIAGCGGGGGGSKPSNRAMLNEEFNGPNLPASFSLYDETRDRLGSTFWGFKPQFLNENGTTFARLRLDSYNPDAGRTGTYYKGTELFMPKKFERGAGLVYEVRMRFVEPVTQGQSGTTVKPIEQPGVIGAFSPLGERNEDVNNDGQIAPFPREYFRDEIDFELLSRDIKDLGGRNGVWMNIYNNYQPTANGYTGTQYNDGVHNQDNAATDRRVAGLDFGTFNTYRVEWRPGQTQWFVNGVLKRTENAADTTLSPGENVDPDNPLQVHLNIWSASNTNAFYQQNDPFAFRPDPAPEATRLKPTSDPAQNRTFYLDVDYVKVTPIPGPTPTPTPTTRGAAATAPHMIRDVPQTGPTDRTRGR